MPYITVGKENSGNIDLYYEDHGAGGPVVLIHGYPLSGASWENRPRCFWGRVTVSSPMNRRGFGKSSQPTVGYNYDTFTEDLHKLVTQLELRDFALAGFSIGWRRSGALLREVRIEGREQSGIHLVGACLPSETPDNPEGVDGSVFDGIEKAVAADRYAFFTGFFKNVLQHGSAAGKRVSEETVQSN